MAENLILNLIGGKTPERLVTVKIVAIRQSKYSGEKHFSSFELTVLDGIVSLLIFAYELRSNK